MTERFPLFSFYQFYHYNKRPVNSPGVKRFPSELGFFNSCLFFSPVETKATVMQPINYPTIQLSDYSTIFGKASKDSLLDVQYINSLSNVEDFQEVYQTKI